eukprot:scaffold262960_cov35-Tisochrysis_lutea.AAC.2
MARFKADLSLRRFPPPSQRLQIAGDNPPDTEMAPHADEHNLATNEVTSCEQLRASPFRAATNASHGEARSASRSEVAMMLHRSGPQRMTVRCASMEG